MCEAMGYLTLGRDGREEGFLDWYYTWGFLLPRAQEWRV